MKELIEFEGILKGKEVILVCNGPSLKNIPFAFLESRPVFTLNFFSKWAPFIKPDYWLVLDPICWGAVKDVHRRTTVFIKGHQEEAFEKYRSEQDGMISAEQFCYFRLPDDVPGLMATPEWGTIYSTSAICAAHLAKYMGASKAFLVGFDCTYGIGGYVDIGNFAGLSDIPHWYDRRKHFSGYSERWDVDFAKFADWAQSDGMEIINLSIPTESRLLPRGDYRDYWEPEGGYYVEAREDESEKDGGGLHSDLVSEDAPRGG